MSALDWIGSVLALVAVMAMIYATVSARRTGRYERSEHRARREAEAWAFLAQHYGRDVDCKRHAPQHAPASTAASDRPLTRVTARVTSWWVCPCGASGYLGEGASDDDRAVYEESAADHAGACPDGGL